MFGRLKGCNMGSSLEFVFENPHYFDWLGSRARSIHCMPIVDDLDWLLGQFFVTGPAYRRKIYIVVILL